MRRGSQLGLGLLLMLVLTCLMVAPAAAGGGAHLRVVLDLSLSMRNNDPNRLAILATMLLYDLVDPNPRRPGHPDSFVVLPFFPDWPNRQQFDGTMPTDIGAPIRATGQDEAERERFKQELMALGGYDAKMTYLYPGLRAALDNLIQEAPDPEDRRIVVLVTDGLPEEWAREQERDLLQGEILRDYNTADTRLYVLGFGAAVDDNWGFFEAPFEGDAGRRLGKAFRDPTGARLVSTMGELFSVGFGYLVEDDLRAQPTLETDLDNGITPPEVKLLAYRTGGTPPPPQSIAPNVNNPRGLMTAKVAGGAYSVQSITGVLPNRQYRLTTDAQGADVAILRKVDPELRLLPHEVEHEDGVQRVHQLREVVAETWFRPKVLARSPTGTDGDQAPLDIQVRIRGPRTGNDPCSFDSAGDYGGPVMGSREDYVPDEGGVTYEIRLRFPENRTDPGAKYLGYIEVIAKIEGQTEDVGEQLTCARAHPVWVYPKITIRTDPREKPLNPTTLSEAEQGCATFDLVMDDPARLAILEGPPIRLRAHLEPSEPGLEDGALAEADFLLDGEPIGWKRDGSTPWYAGLALDQESLLGPHRLCVTIGDPNIDGPSNELGLTVRMQLDHEPYDDFPAVSPFQARLRVIPIPPPSWDDFPWDALWWLLAALLAALLALRQIAPRLPLAEDLGFELSLAADAGSLADEAAAGGAERSAELEPLPPLPWWARLLGLSPARALHDPTSDRVIASLKPTDAELFALKPADGMRAAEIDGTELKADRGLVQVQVKRDYLLLGEAGRWRLRLGYRRKAPATDAAPPDPAIGH